MPVPRSVAMGPASRRPGRSWPCCFEQAVIVKPTQVQAYLSKKECCMRARLREVFGGRLVHRTTILGMVAALCALAPLGPLTGTASAATGHIDEFPAGPTPNSLIQSSLSDPLGLTVGPDGNLWFADADGSASVRKAVGRFHVAT